MGGNTKSYDSRTFRQCVGSCVLECLLRVTIVTCIVVVIWGGSNSPTPNYPKNHVKKI
eukprot:SAG11_NODE_18454_length_490_cov_4.664962_1_plen_57_part_10